MNSDSVSSLVEAGPEGTSGAQLKIRYHNPGRGASSVYFSF